MKKIIILSLLTSLLMAEGWYIDGKYVSDQFPITDPNLKTQSNGGALTADEAYSDGVGTFIIKKEFHYEDANKIFLKYANETSSESIPLFDYVLNDPNATEQEKEIARKMKEDAASSGFKVNGQTCDDGNPLTENDIYNNGVCSGTEIILTSCYDVLNKGIGTSSGEYTIKPDSQTPIKVYCDMSTNGGGWTLIVGAVATGPAYGANGSFWNGIDPRDNKTSSYQGFLISTKDSAFLLANMKFSNLMMTRTDGSNVVGVSSKYSTFVSKKSSKTPISNFTWGYVAPTGGYTNANFVLGRDLGYQAYGDYMAEGLGISGGASSRGTYYGTWHYGNDCGNAQGCVYSRNVTSHAALGYKRHRAIVANNYTGLWFK